MTGRSSKKSSTKKKGVSIGAAMKQRMAAPEAPEEKQASEEVQKVSQPAPQGPARATAQPRKAASKPNSPRKPAKAAQVPAAMPTTGAENDPLESFNTRLPRSLQRRLKVHTAMTGRKIQDVLAQALEEYLAKGE